MLFVLFKTVFLCVISVFSYIVLNKWYRRKRVKSFSKKIVFVTGTDHGFGELLVTKLDRMGLKVYAGCYTTEGAEQLCNTCSERVKTVLIDVTKRETIVAARDFIEKDLGPNEELWGLVNNAGILQGILFDFCQMDDYRQTMEVNFFGVISTTDVFLPLIKKSQGRIVIMSSSAGRRSVGTEPYSASKQALEAYSDGLRRSMMTFGVKVSILQPGFFKTPLSTNEFWLSDLDRTWNNLPKELKEEYGQEYKDIVTKHLLERNPTMPMQDPGQVVRTMIHALSSKKPKARYVIGEDAHYATLLFMFVPDWLFDYMIRRVFRYEMIPVRNR